MKITDRAQQLYDAGFTVIPVKYKRPIQTGWEQGRQEPNGNFSGANGAGIVLGTEKDGGFLSGFDVDCYNKDVSKAFHVWLTDTYGPIPYRVGTKPKFLVPFICDEQLSKSTTPFYDKESRLEILGVGQQFVAYGQSQPGNDYKWYDGDLQTPILKLSSDQVTQAKAKFEGLATAHGMTQGDDIDFDWGDNDDDNFMRGVDQGPVDFTKHQVIDLLDKYEAQGLSYDQWVEVGMALHHQFNGECFELWEQWSQKSDKHDARMMKRKWKSFENQSNPITLRTIIKKSNARVDNGDFEEVGEKVVDKETRFKTLTQAMKDLRPARWLIKGILQRHDTIALFGASGCGKSFLALDQALHIAHGIDYLGRKVHQGPVVYYCGEGYDGFIRRAMAWHQYHNVKPNDNLRVIRGTPQLINGTKDEVTRADIAQMLSIKPVLIIIDTLARASSGLDENSARDMSAAIDLLDKIKDRIDCSMCFVHHTGKGDQSSMRGSSALKAAMDVEMGVNTKNGVITLVNHKMKDSEEFSAVNFTLTRVNFVDDKGQPQLDEDGDEVYSALAVALSEDDLVGGGDGRVMPKSEPAQLLWSVIEVMTDLDHSVQVMDPVLVQTMGLDTPGEGFYKYEVRDEFYARDPAEREGTKRQHFNRAISLLSDAGFIVYRDEILYKI